MRRGPEVVVIPSYSARKDERVCLSSLITGLQYQGLQSAFRVPALQLTKGYIFLSSSTSTESLISVRSQRRDSFVAVHRTASMAVVFDRLARLIKQIY
eukprot:23885-Pleurochrysis_carterae.AAC.4